MDYAYGSERDGYLALNPLHSVSQRPDLPRSALERPSADGQFMVTAMTSSLVGLLASLIAMGLLVLYWERQRRVGRSTGQPVIPPDRLDAPIKWLALLTGVSVAIAIVLYVMVDKRFGLVLLPFALGIGLAPLTLWMVKRSRERP
jgi:hypothetical protein